LWDKGLFVRIDSCEGDDRPARIAGDPGVIVASPVGARVDR
jgi:hypothetical protein